MVHSVRARALKREQPQHSVTQQRWMCPLSYPSRSGADAGSRASSEHPCSLAATGGPSPPLATALLAGIGGGDRPSPKPSPFPAHARSALLCCHPVVRPTADEPQLAVPPRAPPQHPSRSLRDVPRVAPSRVSTSAESRMTRPAPAIRTTSSSVSQPRLHQPSFIASRYGTMSTRGQAPSTRATSSSASSPAAPVTRKHTRV